MVIVRRVQTLKHSVKSKKVAFVAVFKGNGQGLDSYGVLLQYVHSIAGSEAVRKGK